MISKKYTGKNKTKILIALLAILFALAVVTILPGKAERAMYPIKYWDYAYEYSKQYDLDPYLVLSVMKVESNFKPDAVSPKNARGLMQITEKTGKWAAEKLKLKDYNVDRLFDPKQNISIGCWYLGALFKQYNGNVDLMLAAYNGGSGNVSAWLQDKNYSSTGKTLEKIPFKETENYVKRVNNCYSIYERLYKKQGR